MKKMLIVILTIGVLFGCYKLLNKNYEKAIESCVNAGNSQTYCEYHAG
jgi:hypothetical protein